MEIQGYPNYLIYPDGKVFSKKRNIFLKDATNKWKYKFVILCKNHNKKSFQIHRLVAEHYIPNPENKREVDHINRIRGDNRVENLRWATHSENNLNKCLSKNNVSGHKNITYNKKEKKYCYQKIINNKRTHRRFKTLTEALVYKFIQILRFPTR
jgi:hypothetical protein